MFASAGIPNLLPDSTTDPDAPTQSTSAFVFQKQGDVVQDIVLQLLWNETMPRDFPLWDNGLTSIIGYRNPANRGLVQGADYTINGTNITLKSSYLSTLFSSNATNGLKATIFVNSERGASLQLQAYQWAAPTLASNGSRVSNASAENDLAIPITWQGKPQLATVKAQMVNGSYLVDTWTQWLGPLQRGRMVSSFLPPDEFRGFLLRRTDV